MANLLDLVDQLIGDVLAGNIYTDTALYQNTILGPRLRFPNPGPPHPHDSIAGPLPQTHAIPLGDPTPRMHDNRPDFLDPTPRAGQIAAQTPGPKRAELYTPFQAPPDVGTQIETLSRPLDPLIPREQMYNPGPPPPDISIGQRAIIEPNSSFAKGKAFDPVVRTDIYRLTDKDSKIRSNIGGSPPLPDGTPVSKPSAGDLLASQGQPPPDITAQTLTIKNDPSFVKGKSFDPGVRSDIYKFTERNQQIRSNIGGTPDSIPTIGDMKALQGLPPGPSLKFKGPLHGDVPAEYSSVPLDVRGKSLLDKVTIDSPRREFAPNEGQIGRKFTEAHRLGNLYDDGDLQLVSDRGGPFSVSSYGLLKGFDVYAIAHWVRNIGRETGLFPIQNTYEGKDKGKVERPAEMITKGISFVASQFLLAAMNPGDLQGHGPLNQIWNPLSFVVSNVPGARVYGLPIATNPITLGGLATTYSMNTKASVATKTERLLLMRKGKYKKALDGNQVSQLRTGDYGVVGDVAKVGEYDTLENPGFLGIKAVPLEIQVDSFDAAKMAGIHTNLYDDERPYNAQNAIFPLDRFEAQVNAGDMDPASTKLADMFTAKPFPGGTGVPFGSRQALTFLANPRFGSDGFSSTNDAPGLNAAVTDAAFVGENKDSLIEGKPIDENQIYMPFMFQDLRDNPPVFLYFRAFLKEGLAETFAPDWQVDKYYGRVDQVPVYQGTARSVNVSFDIVAWSPKDLPVIYKKLMKLQSMVYPEYDSKGFLNKGPIIRMRIGDLFAGKDRKGLPGYITSLDFAYDDGIWNIEDDFKVPRKIAVSLGYTVLHDGNPGIYPFKNSKEFDINAEAETPVTDASKKSFGVAQFSSPSDGKMKIEVSEEEVRRIFKTMRNK